MIPVDRLVSAYASGWFPMAVGSGGLRWFSPDPRGIIPLDAFRVPRRLARVIRRGPFEIEVNRSFEAVIRACAEAERDGDGSGTWIDAAGSLMSMHRTPIARVAALGTRQWGGRPSVLPT